ncbi:MAG: carboxypeptidase-like regulatory domain-containing protein, partial [candidate division Zixibacteria bacterium]|nr:carboxypeptidase-like regulatory domain-containing protein [candidate division Zixibacteria bacterium]
MLLGKGRIFAMLALLLAVILAQPSFATVLHGTVIDNETKKPVPLTTIRIQGTGQSMLSNDDGQYRLRLEQGKYSIKFSHITHYAETIEITISDSAMIHDVFLRPAVIELPGTTVYN